MAYWARTHHSRQRCVTNVVKLEHFETPFPCLCYKRRQSEPNNQYSQRKQHQIDDVCNKTQAGSPDRRPREAHEARPRYPWAAEGPGQASRQRTSTRQHTGPHWCGGRRRVRRARAGGPGCGAGGRRQGQGGPRDRPLRAAGSRVAISRADRRPQASITRAVAGSSDYSPARRSTSWMMRPQIALTQATAATPRTRERQGRISRKSSNP